VNGPETPLAGRRAVVTGASSGIGLATVRGLLALGADVTGVARRAEAIEAGAAAEPVTATAGWEPPGGPPGRLRALPLDVSDAGAVAAAGLGDDGPLDLLVCAAGTNVPNRRLEELDTETWNTLVDTNLAGCFHLVSACLPALRAARGLVVLVGSVSGAWPDLSGPAYQAAKAGLLAFARGAGVEELEHGVRFSVVAPGLVDTPLLDRRPQPPPPEDRVRMLRPEDVAELITVLARLPARVHVPELTVLPSELQVVGRTW
jgi:NAD(P)-dependent dehydrogenase (short-subunit alcohol dehydrogenase family)